MPHPESLICKSSVPSNSCSKSCRSWGLACACGFIGSGQRSLLSHCSKDSSLKVNMISECSERLFEMRKFFRAYNVLGMVVQLSLLRMTSPEFKKMASGKAVDILRRHAG